MAGQISAGHARALLAVADPDAIADRIVPERLTVRDVERLATRSRKPRIERGASPRDTDTEVWESKLSSALGTKVTIRQTDGAGEIRIAFQSFDQLEDFCRRLEKPVAVE